MRNALNHIHDNHDRNDFLDDLDQAEITQMIMRLFEHWQLTIKQQAMLLGLSPKTNSTIINYKNGTAVIQLRGDKLDRVRQLLAIHKYLRLAFPKNKALAYQWPTTPNRFFDNKTPVDIMQSEGIIGLHKVREYLENYILG